MTGSLRFRTVALAAFAALIAAGTACSNGVPLGPSDAAIAAAEPAPAPTAVAYTDLVPLFASDCTPCHGVRPAGRYSTASYAGVMAAVKAGSASSALVIVTQPGGGMYRFLSGDRNGKAALIRTWVLNGAPPTR
jgi:hypothetical protein